MPLFRRKPQPPPELPTQLPMGEQCERAARATLVQGKTAMRGALYMTNRRLMFYAAKGEARWLIVPFGEVKRAGIYPAPRGPVGVPGAGAPALFIETMAGEHIWYAFDRKEQEAWLPLVHERAEAAAAAAEDDA